MKMIPPFLPSIEDLQPVWTSWSKFPMTRAAQTYVKIIAWPLLAALQRSRRASFLPWLDHPLTADREKYLQASARPYTVAAQAIPKDAALPPAQSR